MMTPRADGWVESRKAVALPMMGPRLQGELNPEGEADLALWGAGELGRLLFTPLEGPYAYGPNMLTAKNGAVYLDQEAPVLLICGARYRGFTPARRVANWERVTHDRAKVQRKGARRRIDLPWGVVLIEERDGDLILSAGADSDEAERGIHFAAGAVIQEAKVHLRRCDRLAEADPMLRSMVMQGSHAALSSIRRDERGRFDGLAAGLHYSAPARTYYRDGYWTLQLLLKAAPAVVYAQIDLLAAGIQPDGEAPSGVIVCGPEQAQAWEELRTTVFGMDWIHERRGDWWSDHFDSPLFFVLTLGDYVKATGDWEPVDRHWPLVNAIFQRYRALSTNGLPVKPRNDRDWADNVFRAGFVSYNIGLWMGALEAISRLAVHDPELAAESKVAMAELKANLDAALWTKHGWYADYIDPEGSTEDHLALDSLTLLRYGAVTPKRAREVLEAVRNTLETSRNPAQPYGDWGTMCAFPSFRNKEDTRSKSVFAYRYHNGSDWPYLSGIYAEERLRRGLSGWRYPMVRWWETCLEKGWMGAVEYFAPPWGRGSLLQGWSAMPAAAALNHRETVLKGDPDAA